MEGYLFEEPDCRTRRGSKCGWSARSQGLPFTPAQDTPGAAKRLYSKPGCWKSRFRATRALLIGFACISVLFTDPNRQTASCAESQTAPAAADLFKQFVATPPVIEDASYVIRWHNGNDIFFSAKWQPNAYSVRQFSKLEDLLQPIQNKSAVSINGRFEELEWSVSGPVQDITLFTNTAGRASVSDTRPPGTPAARMALAHLLNMGVDYVESGTIHWEGDRFSRTKTAYGFVVDGTLVRDEQSRASKLLLTVLFRKPNQSPTAPMERGQMEIVYTYESDVGLPYLPSRVEQFGVGTNGERTVGADMRIFYVRTNHGLLAKDQFDPMQYLISNRSRIFFINNNALMYKSGDGSRKVGGPTVPTPPSNWTNRLVKGPDPARSPRARPIRTAYLVSVIASPLAIYLALRVFGTVKKT